MRDTMCSGGVLFSSPEESIVILPLGESSTLAPICSISSAITTTSDIGQIVYNAYAVAQHGGGQYCGRSVLGAAYFHLAL